MNTRKVLIAANTQLTAQLASHVTRKALHARLHAGKVEVEALRVKLTALNEVIGKQHESLLDADRAMEAAKAKIAELEDVINAL